MKKLFLSLALLLPLCLTHAEEEADPMTTNPELDIEREVKLDMNRATAIRSKRYPRYSLRSFRSTSTALREDDTAARTDLLRRRGSQYRPNYASTNVTKESSEHQQRNRYTRIGTRQKNDRTITSRVRSNAQSTERRTTQRNYGTTTSYKQLLRTKKATLAERGSLKDYKFKRYRNSSRPIISPVPTEYEFIPR